MKRKFVLRVFLILAVLLIIRTVFLHKINTINDSTQRSEDFIKNQQTCRGIMLNNSWCLGFVYNKQISYTVDYSVGENSETVLVDKYIRENIKIIATNDPVLGGQWYVVSTIIDPKLDSGTVVYEDGHIQSSAGFTYIFENNSIIVKTFKIIE